VLKLKSLDLCDVGVFSGDKSFDLSGRLVGIVGSNGRGKSTILEMIRFLITGDTSRFGKSDSVSTGRCSPEQPYGRLVADVDGDPLSVTRWLPDGSRDGKRRMVFGNQSWSTQDDIASEISKLSDVPVKLLSEFVFVQQGRLSSIADDRPSDRARTLQRLFGIEEAEKVRAAAADHLVSLPGRQDKEVLAALRARYVEAETAWLDAKSKLDAVPPPMNEVSEAVELLAKFSNQQQSRVEIAKLEAQLEQYQSRLNREPEIEPDPVTLQRLEALRCQWLSYLHAARQLDSLEDDGEAAKAALAMEESTKPSDLFEGPGPLPESAKRFISEKYRFKVIAEMPESDGVCPVCGSGFDCSKVSREDAVRALRTIEELEELDREHHAAVADHNWKLQIAAERIVAAHREVERITNKIEALTVPEKPDIDYAQVESKLSSYTIKVTTFHNDRVERERARQECDRIRARIDDINATAGEPVSSSEAAAARLYIETHDKLEANRRVLSARATALKESFDSAQALLRKAEESDSRYEAIEPHRARVLAIRDMLHRDAAPAQSVKGCLDSLTSELNDTLAELKARFRVSVRDDGELMAEFRDGTSKSSIRVSRISKGERAVLGLAWVVSVSTRYAPRVGVLCLDEPTDGLDRERVGALRSSLTSWSEANPDRQCIVVTHERSLMGVFDRVIDLG